MLRRHNLDILSFGVVASERAAKIAEAGARVLDDGGIRPRKQRVVRLGQHDDRALPEDEEPGPLDLLDCLGCAAALIDENGLVICVNLLAGRLFGADLGMRSRRLVAADRASDDLLQTRIRTCLGGALLSYAVLLPPVVIARRDGRPIVVQVLPASGLPAPPEACALLLLTCLDARPELPETRLMLLFRLTPAGARLAARLASGETLEDAADALQVSLGTARNQLKAIFAKTETRRQAELVALLWRVSDLAVSTSLLPSSA